MLCTRLQWKKVKTQQSTVWQCLDIELIQLTCKIEANTMWSFKGTTDNILHRIPNNEDKTKKKPIQLLFRPIKFELIGWRLWQFKVPISLEMYQIFMIDIKFMIEQILSRRTSKKWAIWMKNKIISAHCMVGSQCPNNLNANRLNGTKIMNMM